MMMYVPTFRPLVAAHQCHPQTSFKVSPTMVSCKSIDTEIRLRRPSPTFPSAKVILLVFFFFFRKPPLTRSRLAMVFTADFKLGHYMKIPPRVVFFSQILAIVVAGTVQLGVQAL